MGEFFGKWPKIAIITDDNVNYLYKATIEALFPSFTQERIVISLPATEKAKSREKKEEIENTLLENKFNRDCLVIAFGGGVVSDIAGFVAATFLRGIDYIIVPTTLLSMVDSSIGGKCGVNTTHGKNLIGTVYFPNDVLIDTSFLKTLNDYEIKSGLAEIIKAALIADVELFEAIKRKVFVEELITPAREIKQKIVDRDVKENGERRCLNFGHTVAHAIEKLSGFEVGHGESVWFGLIVESYISFLKGFLPEVEFKLIQEVLCDQKYSFDWRHDFKSIEIFHAMISDKKNKNEKVRMVMLKKIGEVEEFDGEYCTFVSQTEVTLAIDRVEVFIRESKNEIYC